MRCFSKFGRKISKINFPVYFSTFILYNMLHTQIDPEILNNGNDISSEVLLKNSRENQKHSHENIYKV